ncbi:Uncharacterised protein [Mycobacteroides abscessus subsp. bolletii]|uniref:hypothetical protein n=1 Tax=Mycobacteroides abscessus TaxID=36809 RepID=UPI00092C4CA9|nr:hypothetical protein [Mycobacteroides abscessus]MBN7302850.1 hypothetical protein [Mycobacteroides abscessus subsp. bolletii]MDO2970283.1 hypothetical protein [Mycobacteroides abscessus subsp. bolletii]MDO3077668.1 hypothetical protein [Mycobacteroides abscessus subsp. bolletii]SHP30324.1 Uncharacterised protein [Mycobacteroides abscessus subsp. bolletii]SHR28465.1 Uncharacterised protein [Mycobacteroides abscessus subsp. bolletii]
MGATPSAKVAAGGVAGAITVVLLFVLGLFNVVVPGEVGSAITVIITSLTSYLVRDGISTSSGDVDEPAVQGTPLTDRVSLAEVPTARLITRGPVRPRMAYPAYRPPYRQ